MKIKKLLIHLTTISALLIPLCFVIDAVFQNETTKTLLSILAGYLTASFSERFHRNL